MDLLSEDLIQLLSKFLFGYYYKRWWTCQRKHWHKFRRIFNCVSITHKFSQDCFTIFQENNLDHIRYLELRDVRDCEITHLPNLESLSILRCKVLSQWIQDCPKLTSLKCNSPQNLRLTPEILTELTQLRSLELSVSECVGSSVDLRQLIRLTRLVCLTSGLPAVTLLLSDKLQELTTDTDVEVTHLTNLVSLTITFRESLQLSWLTKLTHIQALYVPSYSPVTARQISNLQSLRVCQDSFLNFEFPDLTNLEILTASALSRDCSTLTNLFTLSISSLKDAVFQLPNLTDLTLRANGSHDNLHKLTNLTKLRLRGGISFYPENINHLQIDQWGVAGEHVDSLRYLSNLTDLKVYTKYPDVLPKLRQLTQLCRLKIKYTGPMIRLSVMDHYAQEIRQLTGLTSLSVNLKFSYLDWLTELRLLDKLRINDSLSLAALPDWLQGVTDS